MAPAGGEIILTEKIERLVDMVLSAESIPQAAKERLQLYKPQDNSEARKNILFDDVKLLYDQGKSRSHDIREFPIRDSPVCVCWNNGFIQ